MGTAVVNSSGIATFTTKHLPVGTDSITAEYLGDGDNALSAATLSQVVNSDAKITKADNLSEPAVSIGPISRPLLDF